MLNNTTKAKLAAGETVIGCFVRYADPSMVEFVSMHDFDFVLFDGEHGGIASTHLENLTRAAEVRGMTPMVRVPNNQPYLILRFLDPGPHGIHVPWVNSAEEVEQVVRSVKYGPRGIRGLAGIRANEWGLNESMAEYAERANRETLVVVHVETAAAVADVHRFVEVDGLDVIFLGPTDLSHSLGVPGQTDHPKVVEAMEHVADVVTASNKTFGIMVHTIEKTNYWRERGARYMAVGSDTLLRNGIQAYLSGVRG